MTLGPQVAFIDDIEQQILPILKSLVDLNIGSKYFNAEPSSSVYPDKPLESIELVFLDLFYTNGFDPDICAQWIERIVPENKPYNLVIWSKDIHHERELLEVLNLIERRPLSVNAWQKTDFDLDTYDFMPKVQDLINTIYDPNKIVEELYHGEILEIEDDAVLVNCLLNGEKPFFQIRKFESYLFSSVKNIKAGQFVKLQILTKPGSKLINVIEDDIDRRGQFNTDNYFEGLQDSLFFVEG